MNMDNSQLVYKIMEFEKASRWKCLER